MYPFDLVEMTMPIGCFHNDFSATFQHIRYKIAFVLLILSLLSEGDVKRIAQAFKNGRLSASLNSD